VTVSTLTESLEPSEIGIRLSEDIDSSKQQEATTRQRVIWVFGCYEEVLREERFLSRQI